MWKSTRNRPCALRQGPAGHAIPTKCISRRGACRNRPAGVTHRRYKTARLRPDPEPDMNQPLILPFRGIAPDIAETAFIAANAAIIGDVRIGPGSSIWYGCTVRGDLDAVRIGRGSNLQDNSTIHVDSRKYPTIVGDEVLIGHQCMIHGCTIGDRATVGMQSCVMNGATIEPGAMVAAGSLVTPGKVIPSGQLWAGRPAKFMRELDERAVEALLEGARHYARLAQEHKQQHKAFQADGKTRR